MASSLNPSTLCKLYTSAQIDEKITYYQEALDNAVIRMYDKDSTQGRQKVESADIDKIESILATWIKAKALCAGVAGTSITSVNFRGTERFGL